MRVLTGPYWLKLPHRTIAASLACCINLYSGSENINKGGADHTCKAPSLLTVGPALNSVTDEFGDNVVWVETECALAIISSCLVTMGGLLRGWTLKIGLQAWTRSFRFKYAAGSNDADKSKDDHSSYVNLKDSNPNVMPKFNRKLVLPLPVIQIRGFLKWTF